MKSELFSEVLIAFAKEIKKNENADKLLATELFDKIDNISQLSLRTRLTNSGVVLDIFSPILKEQREQSTLAEIRKQNSKINDNLLSGLSRFK